MMQPRTVPFINYPQLFLEHAAEYTAILQEVLGRGAFILQRDVKEFETNLAEFLACKYAIGVGNATDGLTIALLATGIQPGDEVIFPSHTFVASASAIHFIHAIPVPVECGPDHLIDVDAVEKAITKKTKVILPVHLNGRVADMEGIEVLANRHNLRIVEDAAQALGAKYRGKCGGTFGTAAAFSFYPAKSLGCFGDGGAVVTNDAQIAERLFQLRDHGRNADGRVTMWGMNSRLDNLHAAILNYKLRRFPQEISRRREIAMLYHSFLSDLSSLLLPSPPNAEAERFDTFQNYEIEAEQRDALREYLQQHGVGTLIQWGGWPVHQFRELGFTQTLPRTDLLFTRCLMLPMNTLLTNEDVEYVAQMVRRFYQR